MSGSTGEPGAKRRGPELSGAERRRLRGLAHDLSPVVHLGKAGLTRPVAREIDQALQHHELIKVRWATDKESKRGLADDLEAQLGCACVGMVGHVLILYRPIPDDQSL